MTRPAISLSTLLAVAAILAGPSEAQELSRVAGTILDEDGRGLPGVNVFLAGTVEGAVTDSTGSFAFPVSAAGAGELVALADGFAEHRQPIEVPMASPVRIVLLRLVEVAAITARAGGYTAGDEPGATLTSLDVVTTPGAQASVPLAIKALPGVQSVDDGSGLFVRGGDDSETRFFLNGAGLLDAVRPTEPTGSDGPQMDPFLLDRIFFSSGAFGARYGDALSAVVDLETRGRPERLQTSFEAHMAGLGGSVEGPMSDRLGGALTLSRLHVGPIYAVNGSTREYGTAPQGWETSGSLVWDYRPEAQLKGFAIGETFRTAFDVADPTLGGEYAIERESWASILSWRDVLGPARPAASVSRSVVRTEEGGGAYRLVDDRSSTQARASVDLPVGRALVLAAGGDVEHLDARWSGRFPTGSGVAGDAPSETFDDARDALRAGVFVEAEWALGARTALTAGLRSDRSTLAERRTWDPRLSLTTNLPGGVSLLLGGGVYHQLADPLLYARAGDARLAPQRALQLVAGLQAGAPTSGLFRVEAYHKQYDDLAQLDREDRAVARGEGSSRGVDVFLKGAGPGGTNGWIAYSLVDAERTDPDTGTRARAPFDVTHGLVVVAGRQIRPGWNARAAWRYATGRPFTDVIAAEPAADGVGFVPIHGAPFAERQPAFHRLDLSFSHLVFFGDDGLLVVFASLNNVYDRENVLEYRWTDDFTTRIPVRDRTKRSVFVGMSIDL